MTSIRESPTDPDITAIFGLTKTQLRPVVENFADEPVESFDVCIEHQKTGLSGIFGEYIIPTFTWKSPTGCVRKATVFVGRALRNQPEHAQACHYAHLMRCGAPVPRLYMALTDTMGREVIFLEHLAEIIENDETFLADDNNFYRFIELAAHFNAIHPSANHVVCIRHDMGERKGPWAWTWEDRLTWVAEYSLRRLWNHAQAGVLGSHLHQLCSTDRVEDVVQYAQNLVEPVKCMQTGLVHDDFYPGNIGFRRATAELLLFDLEGICFDARFYDIARWLGRPRNTLPRGIPRSELAQRYLDCYASYGGSRVSLNQFIKEVHTLWTAHWFFMLGPQLTDALDERDPSARVCRCVQLHAELVHIMQYVQDGNTIAAVRAK